MTPGQFNQIARFNALAAVNGESLSLGAASVIGLVDRAAKRGRVDRLSLKDGKLDFTLQGMTEIEILFTSLPADPVAGDNFLDCIGNRHRVRYVQVTDVSWLLYCTISKV